MWIQQASQGIMWPVSQHQGGEPDPGRQQAQHGPGALGSKQQGLRGEPGCPALDGAPGVFVGGK